jgi:hypothetical protein
MKNQISRIDTTNRIEKDKESIMTVTASQRTRSTPKARKRLATVTVDNIGQGIQELDLNTSAIAPTFLAPDPVQLPPLYLAEDNSES